MAISDELKMAGMRAKALRAQGREEEAQEIDERAAMRFTLMQRADVLQAIATDEKARIYGIIRPFLRQGDVKAQKSADAIASKSEGVYELNQAAKRLRGFTFEQMAIPSVMGEACKAYQESLALAPEPDLAVA